MRRDGIDGDGRIEVPKLTHGDERACEPAAAPGRLLRRIGRLDGRDFCARRLLLLALGFVWFVWRLPTEEVVLDRNADGIVVLTGGASRIADAIELLAAGRGRRLLISGVNRVDQRAARSRASIPNSRAMVRCCVDFDRSLNTLGNAIETRRWAQARGFRSLIVVTSNYHMPRAMTEIAHQLPDVTLIAVSGGVRTSCGPSRGGRAPRPPGCCFWNI